MIVVACGTGVMYATQIGGRADVLVSCKGFLLPLLYPGISCIELALHMWLTGD